MFCGGTLIVGFAAFWGFGWRAADGARLPQRWQQDIRTGSEYVLTTIFAAVLITAGPIVYGLLQAAGSGDGGLGSLGAKDSAALIIAGLYGLVIVAPTMLATLAGVLTGANFTMRADYSANLTNILRGDNEGGTQRWGVLEGGVPGQFLLILLAITSVVLLVVGMRAALRSPSVAAARLWQPTLVAGVCWLVLAWLASFSLHGRADSGEGLLSSLVGKTVEGTTTLGVSPFGAALAAAVWTAVAVFLGRYTAPAIGRSVPSVLAFLGGRQMDDTWKVLVADSLLRRAKQTPKHLAAVADGLRNGTIPPPAQPLV